MHRELLEKSLAKAKKELGDNRITIISEYLADIVTEYKNQPYGEKALRTKFNALKNDISTEIKIRDFAADALSQYLGYSNFLDFNRTVVTENQNIWFKLRKHKLLILIASILILSFLCYNWITRERWMIWQNDHYEEVNFNPKIYELYKLKIYNKDRITSFYRIKPSCDSEIFNPDGAVKIWYGKNLKKEYEFFTDLAKHPETGKTLKPITNYIKEKYICNIK